MSSSSMNNMDGEKFKFITYFDEENDTLVIEWDDDHPDAELFAEWTEEDWIEAIKKGSKVYQENQDNGK